MTDTENGLKAKLRLHAIESILKGIVARGCQMRKALLSDAEAVEYGQNWLAKHLLSKCGSDETKGA